MILASITQAIRHQNWFAVAVEFLIVIAGVVIGFQITAWNEARSEVREGQRYKQDLLTDLEREAVVFQQVTDYYAAVIDYGMRAQALYESDNPQHDMDYLVAMYNSTQYLTGDRNDATYQALLAQGALDLIEPYELAQFAVVHFAAQNKVRLTEWMLNSNYRTHLRSTMPADIQTVIRQQCGDIRDETGYTIALSVDCAVDFGGLPVHEAARALRADEDLEADLRLLMSTFENYLIDVEVDRTQLNEALERFR